MGQGRIEGTDENSYKYRVDTERPVKLAQLGADSAKLPISVGEIDRAGYLHNTYHTECKRTRTGRHN